MEELLKELLEKAKTDRKVLVDLKSLAVKNQHYKLSQTLLAFEMKHYPEREPQLEQEKIGKQCSAAYALIGFTVPHAEAWLLYKTSLQFQLLGIDFSLRQASTLLALKSEIFNS